MAKRRNDKKSSALADSVEVCRPVYRCVICNKEFNTQATLQTHFRLHAYRTVFNDRAPTDHQFIQCEFCPDVLQNMSKAIGHKYRKHADIETKYFCEQCGKLFPIKVALEQHQKLHLNNDSNFKTGNKKEISDNKNIQKKVKKSGKIKDKNSKLTCTSCSATFFNMSALRYHEKYTHEFVNELMLAYTPPASTKFTSVNGMSFQIYYCHLCGTEYLEKYNLQRHILQIHNEEQIQPIPENAIRCKTCNAIFFKESAYVTHLLYHKDDTNDIKQEFDHNHIDEYILPDNQIPISIQENQIEIKKEKEVQIKDFSPLHENGCLDMLPGLIHEDNVTKIKVEPINE